MQWGVLVWYLVHLGMRDDKVYLGAEGPERSKVNTLMKVDKACIMLAIGIVTLQVVCKFNLHLTNHYQM
jgi:hypothetical protein